MKRRVKLTSREIVRLAQAGNAAMQTLTGTLKKRPKYGNRKVVKNGETFDSVREYERHLVLLDMQKRGEISDLKRQPRFALEVGDLCVCHYVGDWSYTESGCVVIEDAKGFKTPVFRLKWKLAKALYPHIDFRLS